MTTRRTTRSLVFALAFFSSPILTWAQAPVGLARTEGELHARLQSPTSVSLTGSQLSSVAKLAKNQGLALAVDRRADPETPIDLSLANAPIDEIWRRLAEDCKLGYTTYGPMIYLGPTKTARDLNTLAALRREEAGRASPTLKAKLLQASETLVAAPCDSRALWSTLADEAGLRTTNPERMPFDLWPTVHWGPLPLVDRLTLVAVQFDLTFKLDASARTLTFEPVPADIALERSYSAGANPQETLTRIAALAPSAIVKQSGAKILVVGKLEDQERIAASLNGTAGTSVPANIAPPSRGGTPAAGTQVYTLRIKNKPLSELIRVLKEKHGLKIRVDEDAIRAAGISLDGLTSIDVEKVTLEQLLQQAAAPLKLTARKVGDTVEIGLPGADSK